jgi:hypothetical protein
LYIGALRHKKKLRNLFSDPNNGGTASAEALGVKEIRCEQTVLVRLTLGGADYRCPVSITLGGMTSAPFAP